MEFHCKETEQSCGFDFENYDCASLPTLAARLYEDPVQTVPDLEAFAMSSACGTFYTEQEVPGESLRLPMQNEATPVKEGALYAKPCKITPTALNFDDERCTSISVCRKQNTSGKLTKRKKSNRRSYLSNDLPEAIRNQRRTVANARERARVGRMSNGYEALLKSLPKYLTGSKMRKVDILNSAVCHIQNLMRLLSCDLNQSNDMSALQRYTVNGRIVMKNEFGQTNFELERYACKQNFSIQNCSFMDN